MPGQCRVLSDGLSQCCTFSSRFPRFLSLGELRSTNHLGNAEPAVDPKALAVFGAHHPRIFYITGRISSRSIAAQHWLDTHYHFIAQIVTHTVTMRLYATH